MLISRVPEEDNGSKAGRGSSVDATDHSHEYQTASELFEMMASNLNYQSDEDETLTTRDLILIYKNIDIDNKLISDQFKRRSPNQYVETIVYEDVDSDLDLSPICSNEDIMLINDERINLLTGSSSFENTTLCHKLSNLDLCPNVNYDGNFLFRNSYLSNQLTTLNLMPKSKELNSVVPVTLLDYICCKRLEDNYNFDMENIIIHVKHTIDQLKRISNGDYLTDKVKAKWREIDKENKSRQGEIKEAKVLANTTSIPLYVERKVTGHSTKWDDLVHSSIDIRSISKILEKKIIVEVPKALCGSYKLFSKCCNENNLIISCKRGLEPAARKKKNEESRVDVVLQLNRSESGHVISQINSIIILQKSDKRILPLLSYTSSESSKINTSEINAIKEEEKVTELKAKDDSECHDIEKNKKHSENNYNTTCSGSQRFQCDSAEIEVVDCSHSSIPVSLGYQGPSYASYANFLDRFKKMKISSESSINLLQADFLQRMNMTSLPEEIPEENASTYNKKRSPTRTRIKSPYENRSHMIEEKKRRRLLEIRQRREKNKLALGVNSCKVNKHKYPVPPQTANSVTKLSITNKSFYNSIYGQNIEAKPSKTKIRKENKESAPQESSEVDLNNSKLPPEVREMQSQKYTNKSYYLDNAVTEMMYLDMKKNENQDNFSETSSVNDMKMHFKLLSHLETPSMITDEQDLPTPDGHTRFILEKNTQNINIEENNTFLPSVKHTNTPNNSPLSTEAKPSEKDLEGKDPKKASTSTEFRKSIDKIYELINKLGKSDGNETKLCKSKFTAVAERRENYNDGAGETSTVQCSDSGTSVKHHLTSSNASCFSFERPTNFEETPRAKSAKKETPSVPASKIIISAKSQNTKVDSDKSRKDRKAVSPSSRPNNTENPLKAISQFLHEIDNVQKNRNKLMNEKVLRKPEVRFAETKVESRTGVRKGHKAENRLEQHIEKQPRVAPRERRNKTPNLASPPNLTENKPAPKPIKKKVVDIVDEMKEARGEAVRGPSKLSGRLNSLAQPRKIYIQAQIEEFQARYGKSIVTDRLQKLSGSQSGQAIETPRSASVKYRRKYSPVTTMPKQSSNSQPAVLEKPVRKVMNGNKYEPIQTPPNDQFFKQPNANAHNTLKKKIAAVETPDKPSLVFSASEILNDGNKSKVPFIPNEIELASVVSSVEESSTIKSKIHEMIDVIIPSPPITYQSVVETKNKEINANLREETANEMVCEKCQTQKRTDNEKYAGDYHHERPLRKRDHIIGDTIPEENDSLHENEEEQSPESDNAVCRRVSVGTFQKRLKHKNLMLTPTQSMQQILLLQSGDSNSVILRSTISQTLKITNTNSDADMKCLPDLTKMDFRFAQFPIQMPIVGYSFSKYNNQLPYAKENKIEELNTTSEDNSSRTNIAVQCYKGGFVDQFPENVAQDDTKEYTLSNLLKTTSAVKDDKPKESKIVLDIVTVANEIPETKQFNDIVQSSKTEDKTQEQATISNDGKSEECRDSFSDGYLKKISEESINKGSKECVSMVSPGPSNMEYTTSLDVLVGLLNEIQNITTCQSQMATADADDTEAPLEDMEAILQSAAALENVEREARNIISITSLDKLRQLESNASILSFYLSNNSRDVDNGFGKFNLRPLCVDKEVSALLPSEFSNKCTNVPSRIITVNHSTNVSSSLIGILSEPSSHSLLAYKEHSMLTYNEHHLHSDTSLTSLNKLKLIKVPNKRKDYEVDNMPVVVIKRGQAKEDTRKVHKKVTALKTDKQKFVVCKNSLQKICTKNSDFDPVMKMKRDILVTMYSVLVLTVFAALSFPEILYRN